MQPPLRLVLALVAFGAATAGQSSAAFTLHISANTPVAPGAAVTVMITLTNKLSVPLPVPPLNFNRVIGPVLKMAPGAGRADTDPLSRIPEQGSYTEGETMFRLSVKGPDGHAPPYTAYAKSLLHDMFSGNASSLYAPPKGDFAVGFVVTNYYDLSKPGTYTVVAAPRWPTNPPVTSNQLVITVVTASAARHAALAPLGQFDAAGLLPLTALAKLSAQAGVPMGVEWVGPGEGSPVNRQWHNAGVVSIAQQILNAQALQWDYRATWDQGTLALRPAKRKLGGHSVLDVSLPLFDTGSRRPQIASRELADAIGRYLLHQPPPKAFVWTGGFNTATPLVYLTRSFSKQPAYRILDWIAAAGAESFWLVEDLPTCRIAGTNVWCTYTYFGAARVSTQGPVWALLNWRSDPMDVTNPTDVYYWQCPKCPPDPQPPGR